MAVTLMNPDGMMRTEMYPQVAIGTGTRQIHIAGQVAYDEHGQIVAPGDLAGQVVQAYRNVSVALKAAGASFDDVVRLTIYVADWKPEMIEAFIAGTTQAAQELGTAPRPASLIGVSMLFMPGILVEIEATAVLP